MKAIRRHKLFVKNFRIRVGNNPKLTKQFEERLSMFLNSERGYPLNDHRLIGSMKGLRSFSVNSGIRVVYRETDEHYEFLDIGTRNQVY